VLLQSFLLVLATLVSIRPDASHLASARDGLTKEPVYHGVPKYCLLVLGKDAATRIWLVLDGNTLYVDRNGNGDLTEPGEKLTGALGNHFTIDKLVESSGLVHRGLDIHTASDGKFNMELGHTADGSRQQYVGIGQMGQPRWGDHPKNAPVIHFNGPKVLARYGPIYTVPRGATADTLSRRYALRIMLGTPGLGTGTFASYDEVCADDLGPIQADIEYTPKTAGAPPLRQRLELLPDG
jgi:hypothetical protein